MKKLITVFAFAMLAWPSAVMVGDTIGIGAATCGQLSEYLNQVNIGTKAHGPQLEEADAFPLSYTRRRAGYCMEMWERSA